MWTCLGTYDTDIHDIASSIHVETIFDGWTNLSSKKRRQAGIELPRKRVHKAVVKTVRVGHLPSASKRWEEELVKLIKKQLEHNNNRSSSYIGCPPRQGEKMRQGTTWWCTG